MKMCFGFSLLLVIVFACKNSEKIDPAIEKESIKQADIAFSHLSDQKGRNAAFLEYIDSGAVLLRAGHDPIVGSDALQFFNQSNDSSYTLTWEPVGAGMGSGGDIGFTYGIWTFHEKNQPADSSEKGTYVTIWKKQMNGKWKFVLDTGNPGLGKK